MERSSRAVPGRALEDQQETAQLRVGRLLPRLWPVRYERQFWKSAFFARLARDKDNWNLFLRVCHETLFLFRFCAGLPHAAIGPMYHACLNCAMLVALQQIARLLYPELYRSCRWFLVVHQRLYIFLINTANLQQVRRAAVVRVPYQVVDAALMYQVVQGTPNFRTLRALLIATASVWSLIDALPVRGPFALDIAMPFLYLCTSFRLISPLAAQYFSHPRFTADTRNFCRTASRIVRPLWLIPAPLRRILHHASRHLLALLPLPSTTRHLASLRRPAAHPRFPPVAADPPDICDTIQHAWVLVVFVQLFFGFALTTYVVLQLERRTKHRYISHLQQHSPRPSTRSIPHTPSSPRRQAHAPPPATPATSPSQPHPTPAATPTPQADSISPPPSPDATIPILLLAGRLLLLLKDPLSHCRSKPLILATLRAALQHLLVLWALAILMWQVAVAFHMPLVWYIVPVDFVGAHTEWFWELRCGSPHPCCPVK